jgi:hypothetical protein
MPMRLSISAGLMLLGLGLAGTAVAQQEIPDRPPSVTAADQADLDRAMAPVVAKAMSTYPGAKRRFEAGLPRGQVFFVTTRLRDATGRWEQVFVRVESISQGFVTGTIESPVNLVKGFAKGDHHRFAEAAVLDWMIRHRDGHEEGNLVGRFVDTYQPPTQRERDERVLDTVQRYGAALAEAVRSRAVFDLASLDNAEELRGRLAAAGCAALDYMAYRVEATAGEPRVYVMGTADSADTIVLGRHFVVPINGRSADLAAMRQSSQKCLSMRQRSGAAGLMVSAPGQSLPNEFHVFINEFYGVDLHVATETGLWKVSAGLVIQQR